MQAILLSREEVAQRARQLYEDGISQKIVLWDGVELDVLVVAT
jgi:hypothetical protein